MHCCYTVFAQLLSSGAPTDTADHHHLLNLRSPSPTATPASDTGRKGQPAVSLEDGNGDIPARRRWWWWDLAAEPFLRTCSVNTCEERIRERIFLRACLVNTREERIRENRRELILDLYRWWVIKLFRSGINRTSKQCLGRFWNWNSRGFQNVPSTS